VAAGLGDYFHVDPVLMRLAFILLVLMSGAGVVIYLVCWVVMPCQEGEAAGAASAAPAPGDRIVGEVRQAGEKVVEDLKRSPPARDRGGLVAGTILIVLGLVFLVDQLPWLHWLHWLHWSNWAHFTDLWPLVLVIIGIAMILGARREKGA
jgi:phage shock protein PspC (stress-responsive transcriptional regulator)